MTISTPQIIWQGTTQTGAYRIVDVGGTATPRLRFEQQMAPDAMGSAGWMTLNLPFADVLEAAFFALLRPTGG